MSDFNEEAIMKLKNKLDGVLISWSSLWKVYSVEQLDGSEYSLKLRIPEIGQETTGKIYTEYPITIDPNLGRISTDGVEIWVSLDKYPVNYYGLGNGHDEQTLMLNLRDMK